MIQRIEKATIYSHNGGVMKGDIDDCLVDFLNKHETPEIYRMAFPFGYNSLKSTRIKRYLNGKLISETETPLKFNKPEPISYLKDLVLGLIYGILYAKKSDIFVGTDCLLVLCGLILRSFGIVKKVYYCMMDYTPIRYKNTILNSIYFITDKMACYNANCVWPLNKEMLLGREDDKKIAIKKVTWQVLPYGNYSEKYSDKEQKHHEKNKILYFGGVAKNKGSELFVPIVKALMDRGLKDFKFIVIGGGDTKTLKATAKDLHIDNFVEVLGQIESNADIEKIMLTCGVGLAPYFPADKNNFSYYSDPGKVKFYLGCGLPIVITNVPPIAKEIQSKKAGLIANYDAKDFANKIIEIINTPENYKIFSQNAINLGREFSWEKSFTRIFEHRI